MMTKSRRWMVTALAGVGGAGVLVVLGQLLARAGGGCAILCRPLNAALYGALLGVLLVGSLRRT